MSLEKRIDALERSYGTETREEDPAEVLGRRAEFAAKLERAEEKAAAEEAEGRIEALERDQGVQEAGSVWRGRGGAHSSNRKGG